MPRRTKITTVTNVDGVTKDHHKWLKDEVRRSGHPDVNPYTGQSEMQMKQSTQKLPKPKPKTVQRTEPTPGQQLKKEIEDAKKLNQAHNKELKTRGLKK